MPKIIRNIISIPLLLKQSFEIKIMDNDCSMYHSNKFYGKGYIVNNLLILALNENILHIHRNIKRKKKI